MKATWNGAVLAQSDDTVVVESNHYFPAESLRREHFRPSATHTTCGWKGLASYYDVLVDGQMNHDAAWFYPDPMEAAKSITGRVAIWKGVKVEA
jgi:uncharacterized protein (DUF427 family)